MAKKTYKRGLAFGVFDMFHIGHLNLISDASGRCEELIVIVSDTAYVEKNKGKTPVIDLRERLRIVNAIKGVSDVDIQTISYGKKEAIAEYKPDVLFVGDDWNLHTYSGEGFGVKVVYLRHTPGISSSLLRIV